MDIIHDMNLLNMNRLDSSEIPGFGFHSTGTVLWQALWSPEVIGSTRPRKIVEAVLSSHCLG